MPECCSQPTRADALTSMPKTCRDRAGSHAMSELQTTLLLPYTAEEQESWVMNAMCVMRCCSAYWFDLGDAEEICKSRIGNEGNTSAGVCIPSQMKENGNDAAHSSRVASCNKAHLFVLFTIGLHSPHALFLFLRHSNSHSVAVQ